MYCHCLHILTSISVHVCRLFLSFWGLFDCNFVGVTDEKDATWAIGLLWQHKELYSSSWEYDDDFWSNRNITIVFNYDDVVYSYGACDLYSESDELLIEDDGMFTAARGFGEASALHILLHLFVLHCFVSTTIC